MDHPRGTSCVHSPLGHRTCHGRAHAHGPGNDSPCLGPYGGHSRSHGHGHDDRGQNSLLLVL